MTSWLTFIIYGLACFRLAILISEDKCPFGLCEKLRALIRHESKSNKVLRKSDLKFGIQCMRCETVIFGLLIAPYAYYHDDLWHWLVVSGDVFLLGMALSAMAILFNRAFPKR